MTRSEAIRVMRSGQKVTHRLMMEHEYVQINRDGYYQTEDGVITASIEFWALRRSPDWDEDWEIFNEPST